MVKFQSTHEKVLAALESVAGIVNRCHGDERLRERGICGISNGLPSCSLDVATDADCADSSGADSPTTASEDEGGDGDPDLDRRRPKKEGSDLVTKAGRASPRAAQVPQTSGDAEVQIAKTSSTSAKPRCAASIVGSLQPAQAPLTHASTTARRAAATTTAGDQTSPPQNLEIALWRLPTVLRHVPVSRSGWWAGVRDGRYPQPVRLSARCVAWRASDIRSLIESL